MIVQSDALSSVQLDAVEHTDGPVLIFAGAGSGKTRVLTHRIAYLLDEKNVFPDRILAVTFTNKAAGEMKARLERMVGAATRDLWVGTFHATCVRMLRRDGKKIGIASNFAIMDDTDQRSIVRDVLHDLDFDERQISPGAALDEISKAKNALLGPDMGVLVITHYQRLLDYIKPQFVHVLLDGYAVLSGGPEVAHQLEATGYQALEEQYRNKA